MKKNCIILFVLLGVFSLKAQQLPVLTVTVPQNITICSNSNTYSGINFASSPSISDVQYTWTRTNPSSIETSLPLSGIGNILDYTLTSTNLRTITFTVTPYHVGYTSQSSSFSITVIPNATFEAHNVNYDGSLTFCQDENGSISFRSRRATHFTWSVVSDQGNGIGNPNTTGVMAQEGEFKRGTINFTAHYPYPNSTVHPETDPTYLPYSATIEVTLISNDGNNNCIGNTAQFTVIIKPLPLIKMQANMVVPKPLSVRNITVCSGTPIPRIFPDANPGAGTCTWWIEGPNNLGMNPSGTFNGHIDFDSQHAGHVGEPYLNAGSIPLTNIIKMHTSYAGCEGPDVSFSITVLPASIVVDDYSITVTNPDGSSVYNVITGADLTAFSNIQLTQISSTNPNINLDTTSGNINVGMCVPSGTYTLVYQICGNSCVGNVCDTVTVCINVVHSAQTVTIGASCLENKSLGSKTSTEQNVKGLTSENVNSFKNDFVIVSPNPSKGIFKINFKDQLKLDTAIVVYNLIGKKILETKINEVNETQIDLSNYPSGNYLIKISNSEQTISKTLVKE